MYEEHYYNKVDNNGLPMINAIFNYGDIMLSKVEILNDSSNNDKRYKDTSIRYKGK